MEYGSGEEERFPLARITGIKFSVASHDDIEKISAVQIESVSEVTDAKLGLPNLSSRCTTCGATNAKHCEGHFGYISLPYTVLHPYRLAELTRILNDICPACKVIRKEHRVKVPNQFVGRQQTDCIYCRGIYPRMKFKVSTAEEFKKSSITVEICESALQRRVRDVPKDYWNFIRKDPQVEEDSTDAKKRVLSHAQVFYLIKEVDPKYLEKYIPKWESAWVNSFPVTPNRHRVEEFIHGFSNERRLTFDKRTSAYRRLVGFRGSANELGSRVLETFKISKLHSEQSSKTDLVMPHEKTDCPSKTSGLRWVKDVNLGKRSDYSFRMVIHGDPKIKLNEIGVPLKIAERMLIPEVLNRHNLEKLDDCWNLRIFEEGAISVQRKSDLVRVRPTDKLCIGDTIYRPLRDGDVVLTNRPPSIHQHSLIALSVKVLPTTSVLSLNPLLCSPFRGDFDGDCLHGFVPQSIDTRSELVDLVALDKQLFNGQSGKSLLSLSHDSLTAAHLILEDSTAVNLYQKQQLQMFCENPQEFLPAIVKSPSISSPAWTGKQVFNMILPQGFDYVFDPNGVHIKHGELISASEGSSWLNNQTDGNLFHSLAKHSPDKFLDILYSAQEVLCEWLSMTGLSVSLLDLSLTADSHTRENLMNEVFYGLKDAEQACIYQQLLNFSEKFIDEDDEESLNFISDQVESLCSERQKCAALSQASVDAFKGVFRDIQSLAFKYAEKGNSLISMFKAGSKGNMLKLVQQSSCLGVQNSLVPLPFRMPRELSCAAWNDHKLASSREFSKSYIPFGVVNNSFLTGLNPLEAFVHSVTTRASSFSDNAQLPGTLSRKLMFFMRDIYAAYDGTVRSAYGNQVVQFKYDENGSDSQAVGGHPVGVLAGCAVSEAAYSALDQPVSLLETSPLLNLKNALECGSRKGTNGQTMSLYLSSRLGRVRHGFEYGALEVKNHLEGLLLSDITSTVMIIYTPQSCGRRRQSPWICHFHIFKDTLRKRRLNVHSVINALYERWKASRTKFKIVLPNMLITSRNCTVSNTHNEDGDTCCITVKITESPDMSVELDMVKKLVIPYLLGTYVKGFQEIKQVNILWKDGVSKSTSNSRGELYLRVSMFGKKGSKSRTSWSMLMDDCLPIMDLIDWSRSHPENINEFCGTYGIDAGWKHFLNNMESAVSDVGKSILPQHLILVANSLSATGEFVGLTSKGLAQQKEHASVSSPFMQAYFSKPADCFIKAAKNDVKDGLEGSIDALSWGNMPPFGTGGQFELIYSGKGHEIDKPTDVYELLRQGIDNTEEPIIAKKPEAENHTAVNFGAQLLYKYERCSLNGNKKLGITKVMLKKLFQARDIWNLAFSLNKILQKYPINQKLNDIDYSTLMMALFFHPRRNSKIGTGAKFIKVANHPKHSSRCFMLVRNDGTTEDFSYRKCILGAFEIIDPKEAEKYNKKISQHGLDSVRNDLL